VGLGFVFPLPTRFDLLSKKLKIASDALEWFKLGSWISEAEGLFCLYSWANLGKSARNVSLSIT
jgi:hypothetical protein